MKKVVISAGGTGGHLFPAQQLARELIADGACEEILFVGGGLSSNAYFAKSEFDHLEVAAATFSFKKPHHVVLGGGKILRGLWQSQRALASFSPDLVVGFGSFYTLPVLLAAIGRGHTIVLHEQNALPGKVNRLLAPFAKFSAITFPSAEKLLKGKTVHCAWPSLTFQQGLKDPYPLLGGKLTLLIFGGSRGAKGLNRLFLEALPFLIHKLPPFQVIHLTGSKEESCKAKRAYKHHNIEGYIKEFDPHMHHLYAKSDVAITRAGAATIVERIAFALPGVVVPYPYASEDHQAKNAEFFVKEVKGGVAVDEKPCTGAELAQLIIDSALQKEKYQKHISNYREKQEAPTFVEALLEHL